MTLTELTLYKILRLQCSFFDPLSLLCNKNCVHRLYYRHFRTSNLTSRLFSLHLFGRGSEIKKEIVAYKDADRQWKPYCDKANLAKADTGHPCDAGTSATTSHEDEASHVSHYGDPCTPVEVEVHKECESTTGEKEGEPSCDVPVIMPVAVESYRVDVAAVRCRMI